MTPSGGSRLLFLLLLSFSLLAEPKPFLLIAGTVFREPGFALPGAQVQLVEEEPGKKPRTIKAAADSRGEFAFRLAAKDAKFVVKASAPGFIPQEKEVTASPGVRTEVFFELKPGAK